MSDPDEEEGLARPEDDYLDDEFQLFESLTPEEQKAIEAEQEVEDTFEEIAEEREQGLEAGGGEEWVDEEEVEPEVGAVANSGARSGPFSRTFWRPR